MAILQKSATELQFTPPSVDVDGNPLDPTTLSYRLYIDGVFSKLYGPGATTPIGNGKYSMEVGSRLQSAGTFSLTISAVSVDQLEGPQSDPTVITVVEIVQTPVAPTDVVAV